MGTLFSKSRGFISVFLVKRAVVTLICMFSSLILCLVFAACSSYASSASAFCDRSMVNIFNVFHNIHNIFNVANFIEYPDAVPAQPYPKRRKLDKANNYLVPESLAHAAVPDYHDTGARVRSHNVSYRPYSDLQQHAAAAKQKASKKSSAKSDAVVRSRVTAEEEAGEEGTTVHHLFPEILCLIFEKLDLRSKGRVAQVNISKYFMAIPIETRTHAIPIKIT